MSRLGRLRALLAWLVPSVGYPSAVKDRGGRQHELCHWLQGRQTFHSSSICQSLCDRGRFKCVMVAPNLFVSVAWWARGRWRQPWLVPRTRWPSTQGLGPQSSCMLTWQTALTGSSAPAPSLQRVRETYSHLNWASVTYLNCFSDLIRIFHLQQAILKYCLYTNSHSE